MNVLRRKSVFCYPYLNEYHTLFVFKTAGSKPCSRMTIWNSSEHFCQITRTSVVPSIRWHSHLSAALFYWKKLYQSNRSISIEGPDLLPYDCAMLHYIIATVAQKHLPWRWHFVFVAFFAETVWVRSVRWGLLCWLKLQPTHWTFRWAMHF